MNATLRQQLDVALTRLAAGDRAAFDEAFGLLEPVLLPFVRSQLRGDPEQEDVAQNTLLRVFGRICDYRTGTDALAWVLTLASYEIATVRKRRQRHAQRQLEVPVSDLVSVDQLVTERETTLQLEQALQRLSPGDRALLLPDDLAPREPRERKRKQRAMERLRGLWRNLNGED